MPVFTANIPGVLNVGDRIEIGGRIKENARKMSVNLCAQEGEEPRDVVLHFDVRFHRDNIISLSRKNGVWIGSGNYDTNYNMFVPGTVFRIVFEIKDTDVITIYCQGKFHSNFLPKIPLSMAKFIVAWADVERISHCYFHFNKAVAGDEGAPGFIQGSPRLVPNIETTKRCQTKVLRNPTPASAPLHTSYETSDEDKLAKDRFIYETLTCQQADHKYGSPKVVKGRDTSMRRNFTRKFRCNASDSEKNDTDDYSEEIGYKNVDTSQADSGEVLKEFGFKKRLRRGKFGPFAQVVNFMEKSRRKN